METLGERIRNRRKQVHMTQQELADRCGITSKVEIFYYENDKRIPRSDKLEKIADALGVTVMFLQGKDRTADYYGRDTAEIAQKIYEDHNLRQLFDAAKDASPRQLEIAREMLKVILQKDPD